MTNRPAGGARSKRWETAPYDWYREGPRAVEQIFAGLGPDFFGDDLIWDPCCGKGNVLDVARRWGHETVGSDVVDRLPQHRFFRGNILTHVSRTPRSRVRPDRPTSVISNPPFSYEKDIGERVVARILECFDLRRAAFIFPISFMAGQNRWRGGKFSGRWRPSQTLIYTERHTMPPGHLIDEMATPYEGGMQDYCVLVFTRPHRWRTETVWLPPGPQFPPARRATTQGENDGKPQTEAA